MLAPSAGRRQLEGMLVRGYKSYLRDGQFLDVYSTTQGLELTLPWTGTWADRSDVE